jgi:hypothetical protein
MYLDKIAVADATTRLPMLKKSVPGSKTRKSINAVIATDSFCKGRLRILITKKFVKKQVKRVILKLVKREVGE